MAAGEGEERNGIKDGGGLGQLQVGDCSGQSWALFVVL